MRHHKTYLIIFVFFNFFSIYGQRTIKGKVIDVDNLTIPGVRIFENDTTQIGETDINGIFEITTSNDTNKLTFFWIGYDRTTISLSENCNYIEFILIATTLYHDISNQKIDRLRKKAFDKLPDLYLQAFNNGIFKNEKPCFEQDFVPIKPTLDSISKAFKVERKVNKIDYKELDVGDVVKIPFEIDSSGTWTTKYSICKNCTEKDYDYVIEGEILNKNRRKFTLEIKITKIQNYDFLEYRGKNLGVGSNFKYEMKYFQVIIDK